MHIKHRCTVTSHAKQLVELSIPSSVFAPMAESHLAAAGVSFFCMRAALSCITISNRKPESTALFSLMLHACRNILRTIHVLTGQKKMSAPKYSLNFVY